MLRLAMVTNASFAEMPLERTSAAALRDATHNLSGQRLGRKGQGTRERIVRAMMGLLDGNDPAPITLSAIAREACVGMSTLYLYFPDLAELLLAVLRRVMDHMEAPFIQRLCTYWADDSLEECCETFVRAHFEFWQRHARLLQMRNSMADARDSRLVEYRHSAIGPVLERLAWQMNPLPGARMQEFTDCAIVLFTGLERTSTVVINPDFAVVARLADDAERLAYIERLVRAQVNVFHLVIREMRARTAMPRA